MIFYFPEGCSSQGVSQSNSFRQLSVGAMLWYLEGHWTQAAMVTGRLGHRLSWSLQAWLGTGVAFSHRVSSPVPQAVSWHSTLGHRLHTLVLTRIVPSFFAQLALAFANECCFLTSHFCVGAGASGSMRSRQLLDTACFGTGSLLTWVLRCAAGKAVGW